VYSQQSYLNGLIKFDLTTGEIVATLDEPLSDFAKANYPSVDEYPHDSGDNAISIIDYRAQTEVGHVSVGKFPQRSRLGRVQESSLVMLSKAPG
jgi:hypothetical protein